MPCLPTTAARCPLPTGANKSISFPVISSPPRAILRRTSGYIGVSRSKSARPSILSGDTPLTEFTEVKTEIPPSARVQTPETQSPSRNLYLCTNCGLTAISQLPQINHLSPSFSKMPAEENSAPLATDSSTGFSSAESLSERFISRQRKISATNCLSYSADLGCAPLTAGATGLLLPSAICRIYSKILSFLPSAGLGTPTARAT